MMYDVHAMKRTNIYLEDRQMAILADLSKSEGRSAAALVREAVDSWIKAKGVQEVQEDEWSRRFGAFLARRQAIADKLGLKQEDVDREVMEAVREVRRARRARRR